jgi:hypothetical protein
MLISLDDSSPDEIDQMNEIPVDQGQGTHIYYFYIIFIHTLLIFVKLLYVIASFDYVYLGNSAATPLSSVNDDKSAPDAKGTHTK